MKFRAEYHSNIKIIEGCEYLIYYFYYLLIVLFLMLDFHKNMKLVKFKYREINK